MYTFTELMRDKHSYVMLVYLLKHGETKQNDFFGIICRNHQVILRKLEILQDLGLVTETTKEGKHSRHLARYWVLTTKGRILGEHLAVAERILEGNFDIETSSMEEVPRER